MKIANKDIDEMVTDLRTKGRKMLELQKENVKVDEALIKNDIVLLSKISPALQEDGYSYSEKQVRDVHKDYNNSKLNGSIKRSYILKDEIRNIASKFNSFKDIMNAINPIEYDE